MRSRAMIIKDVVLIQALFTLLGSYALKIAVISDTHVGENCPSLDFEVCKPMRNLRDAVSHLNSVHADSQLDGVFISGDLTASAQEDQMKMVRTLLDPLAMPWFPLLGNHDSWPYNKSANGSFTQHDSPDGDQLFAKVFEDKLADSASVSGEFDVSGFANSTCPNGNFPGVETWHTNFQVRFAALPELRFLNLDWVARGSAWPYAGVGPEAELHDYPCGTTEWLDARLKDGGAPAASGGSARYFLVQHHPFHNRDVWGGVRGTNKIKNFTFDVNQDARVQEILSQAGRSPEDYLGVVSGHMHRWRRNVSAFTPFTASDEASRNEHPPDVIVPRESVSMFYAGDGGEASEWWQPGLREFETSASKGWVVDEAFTSAVTYFEFNASKEGGFPVLSAVRGEWLTPSQDWSTPPAYALQ